MPRPMTFCRQTRACSPRTSMNFGKFPYRVHLHLHSQKYCSPLKCLQSGSWLYHTVFPFPQVERGLIRSIRPSMMSLSKPTMTMPSLPATSSKQPSPLQHYSVNHHLLSYFHSIAEFMAYRWADVLGSMAFTPVKNDMIGNIKVSMHLRPTLSQF